MDPPQLPSITGRPRAKQPAQERDEIMEKCMSWHKRYDLQIRCRSHLLSCKEKRVSVLEDERKKLLIEADACAVDISESCGYKDALQMTDWVRMILARSMEEVDELLLLWREPGGPLQDHITQLMEIRAVMTMAMIIERLCDNDAEKVQLNRPIGKRHAAKLVRRLTWCPLVYKHFDEILSKDAKYGVVRLASGDTEKYLNYLQRTFNPGSQGAESRWAFRQSSRLKYLKACIVVFLATILHLPEAANTAQRFKEDIECAKLGGITSTDEAWLAAKQAQTASVKWLLPYHYESFHPQYEGDQFVKFGEVQVEAFAAKWGYGGVDKSADPSKLGRLV